MRENKLIGWMKNGDPEKVPVMFGGHYEQASSYFGIPRREVNPEIVERAMGEMGTWCFADVGSPMLFEAIEFCHELSQKTHEEKSGDGTTRRYAEIETPGGTLKQIWEAPEGLPGTWVEHYVKNEKELEILRKFVILAYETITTNPHVRNSVVRRIKENMAKWSGVHPYALWVFAGPVELTCAKYMSQEMAIYTLMDDEKLVAELSELQWETTKVWLECGLDAGVEIYGYAVNGLEIYSPAMYEKFFIPSVRRINNWIDAHGKMSWLHTCGKMHALIETGVYDILKPAILESFSHPPLGDVTDLKKARCRIGDKIVTRGGVNVNFFYGDSTDSVRMRVKEVMESTSGFRHMVGDTNSSFPPYPKDNIMALMDAVSETKRMFAPDS